MKYHPYFHILLSYHLFDENCLSDFDKRFQDFALLEPIATFMCYPFREDVEVDLLASKIAALVSLNTSAVEEEILTVQADIEFKSRAHGHLGTYSQREGIQTCGNVLPPCLFPHTDY